MASLALGGAAVATAVVAAVWFRGRLFEEYWVWVLGSGKHESCEVALEYLGSHGSSRWIRVALERVDRLEADAEGDGYAYVKRVFLAIKKVRARSPDLVENAARALLEHRAPRVRALACGVLMEGERVDESTAQALSRAMREETDPEVRWLAAATLAKLGPAPLDGMAVLCDSLTLASDDMVIRSAEFVRRFGERGREIVPCLRAALRRPDLSDQAIEAVLWTVRALGEQGGSAAEELGAIASGRAGRCGNIAKSILSEMIDAGWTVDPEEHRD